MANSINWSTWYGLFNDALADAGYNHISDTPVFDFIGSEGEAAALVDKAIFALYNKGLSPKEVVVELEDRDGFIRKHNIDV